MQDYDTVLKLLLRGSARGLILQLTDAPIVRWLNVELPRAQQPRVDLLGETESGDLEHIELQSQNHPQMPLRMLEYRLGIYRQFGVFPRQTVLYAGKEKLRMPSALEVEHLSFQYKLVDASELDGEALLASEQIGDNVLAILARVPSQRNAIRRIMARIAELDSPDRQDKFGQLLLISGLRELEKEVGEEADKMPITESILDHKIIGPAYRRGERAILRKQLEKRFGPLPESALAQLDQSSIEALEEIGIRLLDAASLDELFP